MPKQNRKPGIHLRKTEARRKITATTPDYYPAEYYWILIAKNGKTIARSSETYKRKGSAVRSIKVAEVLFLGHTQYYDHTSKEVEQVDY